MKAVVFSIFFLSYSASFAQKDSAISFVEVVSVNIPKNILFDRGRDWVNNYFTSMKAVLSINDIQEGELAGKGVMKFDIFYMGRKNTLVPVTVEFKLNLKFKDGRYRYAFSDFNVINFWGQEWQIGLLTSNDQSQWFGTKKWSLIAYQETKEKVNEEMRDIILSLKAQINKNDDF